MISWDELIRQMQACADCGDTEIAHSDADALLLEALRFLQSDRDNSTSPEDLERFIAIYHGVRKWYA